MITSAERGRRGGAGAAERHDFTTYQNLDILASRFQENILTLQEVRWASPRLRAARCGYLHGKALRVVLRFVSEA